MMTQQLVTLLQQKELTLFTAESCTGGLIAAAVTDCPGSSAIFTGGVVVYSNELKQKLLNVSPSVFLRYGAVSRECAAAMLDGASAIYGADCAIAVTGIAGPGGGSPDKPVGLVYLGVLTPGSKIVEEHIFVGDRQQVREQTKARALQLLVEILTK